MVNAFFTNCLWSCVLFIPSQKKLAVYSKMQDSLEVNLPSKQEEEEEEEEDEEEEDEEEDEEEEEEDEEYWGGGRPGCSPSLARPGLESESAGGRSVSPPFN